MKNKKQKVLAFIIAASVLLGACLLPHHYTFADNDETHELTFTFRINESDTGRLSLAARDSERTVLEPGQTGIDFIIVAEGDEDGQHSIIGPQKTSDDSPYNSDDVSVVCDDAEHCTMTVNVPISDGVRLPTPGGVIFALRYADGSNYNTTATNLTENADFEFFIPEQTHDEYSGRAWVAWACTEHDGVCLNLLEIPPAEDNVNHTTRTFTYFSAADVVDERTGESFSNFDNEDTRGFIFEDAMERWVANYKVHHNTEEINWATVDIAELLTGTDLREIEDFLRQEGICDYTDIPGEFESCVDNYIEENNIEIIEGVKRGYTGEPINESSYVSYGENAFNVIIYADNYAATTAVMIEETLDYIPYGFGVDPVDLVGSSLDNPAKLNMPLLDESIYLDSTGVNNFEIENITVANERIPEEAVNVARDNNSSAFVVNFGSNFYDNVVLKIESTDNNIYYLEIHRVTFTEMKFDRDTIWNNHFNGIRVELIFDEETSYEDYELTAQIVYTNGTSELVELENLGWVDTNYGGNLVFTNEYSGEMSGKGLKRANYGYEIPGSRFEEDIETVYFNIRYSGTTEENYAGTFAGSGRGIVLVNERRPGPSPEEPQD